MYRCTECENKSRKWIGKCPVCNKFNTMEEFSEKETNKKTNVKAVTLKNIHSDEEERIPTNINELDRVLSGGIVSGSLTLIGGEPGVGKSTLLLQICQSMKEKQILYISGEESTSQIVLRAKRLGLTCENLLIMSNNNVEVIEATLEKINPTLLIIDSIQTMYTSNINSTAGSVSMVRECCTRFINISKTKNIATILVGHVTKEGSIAGPKVLEHMVDTVLYFEGERNLSYRIIRVMKNRFGSTNEIGIFKMEEKGLIEIQNPSEYMLSGRPENVSGSIITCTIEGSRPILAEVQALVSATSFGIPRRTATGCDYNRVVMLLAVLEKKMDYKLSNYDSYVNIAGGMKINEPSLDTALITAICSSYKNIPINPKIVTFGEVGLSGEIRAVNMAEKRIKEAQKLGFEICIIPKANEYKKIDGMKILNVSNISELLNFAFKNTSK
ncbi:MAG: DNA repair protein RadA [Defluviitaleaceae bacterium]|nr:DNA repair protein RadA [Defluviitaleaceae bacterium]